MASARLFLPDLSGFLPAWQLGRDTAVPVCVWLCRVVCRQACRQMAVPARSGPVVTVTGCRLALAGFWLRAGPLLLSLGGDSSAWP